MYDVTGSISGAVVFTSPTVYRNGKCSTGGIAGGRTEVQRHLAEEAGKESRERSNIFLHLVASLLWKGFSEDIERSGVVKSCEATAGAAIPHSFPRVRLRGISYGVLLHVDCAEQQRQHPRFSRSMREGSLSSVADVECAPKRPRQIGQDRGVSFATMELSSVTATGPMESYVEQAYVAIST